MAGRIHSQNIARDAADEMLHYTVGLWRAGLFLPVRRREFRARLLERVCGRSMISGRSECA